MRSVTYCGNITSIVKHLRLNNSIECGDMRNRSYQVIKTQRQWMYRLVTLSDVTDMSASVSVFVLMFKQQEFPGMLQLLNAVLFGLSSNFA